MVRPRIVRRFDWNLERFVDQFTKVGYPQPIFRTHCLDRVLKHDQVLGTGHDEAFDTG
jgi:hypothetical protein